MYAAITSFALPPPRTCRTSKQATLLSYDYPYSYSVFAHKRLAILFALLPYIDMSCANVITVSPSPIGGGSPGGNLPLVSIGLRLVNPPSHLAICPLQAVTHTQHEHAQRWGYTRKRQTGKGATEQISKESMQTLDNGRVRIAGPAAFFAPDRLPMQRRRFVPFLTRPCPAAFQPAQPATDPIMAFWTEGSIGIKCNPYLRMRTWLSSVLNRQECMWELSERFLQQESVPRQKFA
ncbi:hypothetical protein PG984_015934 [Apiospora sp. TS-2023a]